MIYCPICGTANREGSKFCNECGARLTPAQEPSEKGQVKCPMCGAFNPEGSEVCTQCGARLKPLTTISPEELPLERPLFIPEEKGPEGAPPAESWEEIPEEAADIRSRLASLSGEEEKPEPTGPEEAPQVPVFPEEVMEEIPETEIPDILASLRAKIRETEEALAQEEAEEEVPSEEIPEIEIPSWLREETPETGAVPEAEVLPRAEEQAPPAEEKPAAEEVPVPEMPSWLEEIPSAEEMPSAQPEEASAPEEEAPSPPAQVPPWLLEEAAEAPPAGAEETTPALEIPEEEIPDWLKEAEEAVPLEQAPPPAEWLKEVELPWLEEEEPGVEAPVMAEIPPWLEALRPLEMAPEAPPKRAPEEGEEEHEGILTGLKGLLKPVEITPPREPLPAVEEKPRPSRELLQTFMKLAYVKSSPPAVKVAKPRTRPSYGLLYLILLLAVLVPLLLNWPPMPVGSPPAPPEVQGLFQTVNTLPPNAKVLVAFDYEPYMAGELNLIARPILNHLKDRKAKVAVISLVPTGPAIAQEIWDELPGAYAYGDDFVNLGYIPGREAGLRAIAHKPLETIKQDYIRGASTSSFAFLQGISEASDWNLIVVFTGQPSNLLNWIEQIGSLPGVNLAAGVSAGLKPYVMPYYEAGQLKGAVAGLPEAAHYEDLLGKPDQAAYSAPVQAIAVLISLLLILGGSIFGSRG